MSNQETSTSVDERASTSSSTSTSDRYLLDQYLQGQPDTTTEKQGAGLVGTRDQSGLQMAMYIKGWERIWEQAKTSDSDKS
ncbi:hypothetical protein PG993_005040 [Apiospora rasikravindrae]|uniref:ACB domain-containing protein n=1 Tax=Apiospora rasikravindrae TaxID=990691 RepID=A0ABR1TEG9_9PEZI